MLARHGHSLSLEQGSAHQASPGAVWAHRCQLFLWRAAGAPGMGAGTSPLCSQLPPCVERPEQGPGVTWPESGPCISAESSSRSQE